MVENEVVFEHPLAVKIRKQIVQALSEYKLLEANDKLMVCVSGGKDSSILLALLTEIQKRSPYKFSLEAVILDQKQPGFNVLAFKNWVESLNVKLHIVERDTYSIVKEKTPVGQVYCALCSKLRRGILYDYAVDHGFTKLALGHHSSDLMETLLMNLFYTGKLATMPPKLKSDDQRNILIRPLMYVDEADLTELSKVWNLPIIPCNLCGSQEGMKRKRIKKLILDLQKEIPEIRSSMLTAMSNVHTTHLLDHDHWNFHDLSTENKKESSAGIISSSDLF